MVNILPRLRLATGQGPARRGLRSARTSLITGITLIAALLAGHAYPAHADGIRLPDIGASGGAVISPEQERRIGQAFMRQIRRSMPIDDDPEIKQYFTSLGFREAAYSTRPEQPFNFFLVKNHVINAFAGPGGNIGIHSGLLLLTQDESELASVMAHEIAHVTQRHLPRAFEQAQRMSIPTMAAMIGALIVAAIDPASGQAALAAVQGASVQMQIDYTRANEAEADRIGMQMLYHAGFDPRAMPRFFQRMNESSRFSGGKNIPEFLRSHPLTSNRIAEAKARSARYPVRLVPSSQGYLHARARVAAEATGRPADAVARFAERLKQPALQQSAAEHYGYLYALLRDRQTEAAAEQAAWLLRRDPERLSYLIAAARVAAQAGDTATALDRVERGLALYPGDTMLQMIKGEMQLLARQPAAARDTLSEYVRRRPQDPNGFLLLARAAEQSGRRVESGQMLAEYHFLTGNLQAAIAQLRRTARIKPVSFIETSRIESRLRDFEQERELEHELFGT